MTPDANMIQAGCAVVSVLSLGIGALWRRVENNNKRHDADIAEMKTKLKECERREDVGRDQRGVMTTVIELLWQIAPIGAAKQRARWLLDTIHASTFSEGED